MSSQSLQSFDLGSCLPGEVSEALPGSPTYFEDAACECRRHAERLIDLFGPPPRGVAFKLTLVVEYDPASAEATAYAQAARARQPSVRQEQRGLPGWSTGSG